MKGRVPESTSKPHRNKYLGVKLLQTLLGQVPALWLPATALCEPFLVQNALETGFADSVVSGFFPFELPCSYLA